MLADYTPIDRQGITYRTTSLILQGAVDALSHVSTTVSIAAPSTSLSYADITATIQQTLTAAYQALLSNGGVQARVSLTAFINGTDVSGDLVDNLSITWPDDGNGSCTLALVGYNPFATLPTADPIQAGAPVSLQSQVNVDGVVYDFILFTGYVADFHYSNRVLSVACADLSYPLTVNSARFSSHFGRTHKSNLLQLVANKAGITDLVNERIGQVEDEVMVLPVTANEEFPLDFMRKVSVPQTWKLGFTPEGTLRVYREQIQATPDYTLTDDLIIEGSFELSKNIDGVVNIQEVTGVSYPIGQKIDQPDEDPCKKKTSASATSPTQTVYECRVGEELTLGPESVVLTKVQNACKATTAADDCHICIKSKDEKPDNTPPDSCADPTTPAPPLSIVEG